MKLLELYVRSLVEPPGTIESIDPENAEIIKKVNQYNDLRNELIEKGVSTKTLGKMNVIRKNFNGDAKLAWKMLIVVGGE